MMSPQPSQSRFRFVNEDANSRFLSKIEAANLRPVTTRHVQKISPESDGRRHALTQHFAKRRSAQKRRQPVLHAGESNDLVLSEPIVDTVRPETLNLEKCDDASANEIPKPTACIWSQGNYLDPFASTDIKVDAGVYRMLQYFTFTWRPFTCACEVNTHLCIFPDEVHASLTKDQVPANTKEIVQTCLNNKTHMYALLASCAGRMKHVSQNELYTTAKPESYMVKAIHALREHLINTPEVDQQVIRDIFFMYTCDFFSQNLESAEKFLRILKSMADRIGGFSCIDTYDRRLYWCGDIGLALETGGRPILPALEGTRIYHPYRFGASSILKLGSALKRSKDIFLPLEEIVSDIISCAQSIQCILTAQLTIDKERMVEHGTDFLHRLLCLPAPERYCGPREKRSECYRQALLLWTFNVMIWQGDEAARTNQTNPRLARPLIAARMRQAISQVDNFSSSCWDSQREILLWILSLGSCVEGPGDDQSWFEERFVQLAELLQIKNTEQMSEMFRNYLYLDKFEKANLIWLMGLIVHGHGFQTETLREDVKLSSLAGSSEDSTSFSNVGPPSVMTSDGPSTPSSELKLAGALTLNNGSRLLISL